MDLIFIRNLSVSTIVGHYARERVAAQTLEFNIELAIPGDAVYASDRIADTVNYAAVAEYIKRECDAHHFKLLERMADHLARGIITQFGTPYVRLSVAKTGILALARQVGVSIERRATPTAGEGT
jgi:dihydroneopterin aldolase